jgi:hypothetical protein|tara:strand:+ start:2104 stop:2400 length:297 start_codon:yes stop_codon:yes gene_type:complete
MSRNLTQPFFPTPPAEYSRDYFDGIARSFTTYVGNMQNPGEGRNTGLVLTNLQTDDSGLENGALFQQSGFVKITLINTPHVRGQQADSAVGSVTVSTP